MPALRPSPDRVLHVLTLTAWVAQPFTLGPLLSDSLSASSSSFRAGVTLGGWALWFLVLLALVVIRPITLTISRVLAPAALPAAVWAATGAESTISIVVGVVGSAITGFFILLPSVGDRFVDGVSYGDERRFPLRPPGPILIFILVPTWALTVAGLTSGPLLLADQRWVVGALATPVGLAVAAFGFQAMHRLTARFIVFVPNGVVVHDGTVMREPVLFHAAKISWIGPAEAGTAASDFTAQAIGLALQLQLSEPVKLPVVIDRSTTAEEMVSALLISPSRPMAVLKFAEGHGFAVA